MMHASIKIVWCNYNFSYRSLGSCSLLLSFLKKKREKRNRMTTFFPIAIVSLKCIVVYLSCLHRWGNSKFSLILILYWQPWMCRSPINFPLNLSRGPPWNFSFLSLQNEPPKSHHVLFFSSKVSIENLTIIKGAYIQRILHWWILPCKPHPPPFTHVLVSSLDW